MLKSLKEYAYILYNHKLKTFYTVLTVNFKRRLSQHSSGLVPFTAKGLPYGVVYIRGFVVKLDAQKEESFLKAGKGRERIQFLLKNMFDTINGELPKRS